MTAQRSGSPLEARYRRLTRWYPRTWRAANEDAFVGTLLDVADAEGRAAPTRRERLDIVGHAVSARLDRIVVPHVRDAGSTIALTMGTGFALAEFLVSSWAPWIHGNPVPESLVQVGPFRDTGFVFAALWLVALAAALAGRLAVGRVALVVCILAAVVTPYWFVRFPGGAGVSTAAPSPSSRRARSSPSSVGRSAVTTPLRPRSGGSCSASRATAASST